MELETSFMSFLLKHQQKHNRTLNFLILMESIMTAALQLSHVYQSAELARTTGTTGDINLQGEKVTKLDRFAHEIIEHHLTQSGQVLEATSEEEEEALKINKDGRYFLYFDPLDGSSNVKHTLPVGFLFGIAKRSLDSDETFHLRKGRDYIAAGMFLIPSGQFTFALKGSGTWRFIKDPSGTYIRPHQVILPNSEKSWELSWNVAHRKNFRDPVQEWIAANEAKYAFRYCGSLAVDFHRLLNNGGMFFYPAISQHSDASQNRPNGKLRLMYESNVVAFLAEEAGGAAVTEDGSPILDIEPKDRHQRSALYIGNKSLVNDIAGKLAK
ncbi:UNVERIFIED_CONTAM: hypothetical protein GTU68_008485 [Idotea baltica]|nr:hypothetical protein [Idotea baltica]